MFDMTAFTLYNKPDYFITFLTLDGLNRCASALLKLAESSSGLKSRYNEVDNLVYP
jgi:hypothetical protein